MSKKPWPISYEAYSRRASRVVELERQLDKVNGKVEKLTKALEFYSDPQTYFAIAFFTDTPCGDFATDESETGELGIRPGKRARQTIADTEEK